MLRGGRFVKKEKEKSKITVTAVASNIFFLQDMKKQHKNLKKIYAKECTRKMIYKTEQELN